MTEDEARTKMCCGPQVVAMTILATAPVGVVEMTADAGRCIGSACMAWRVVETPDKNAGAADRDALLEAGWTQREPSDGERGAWGLWFTYPDTGYCGLAGRPQ